MRFYTIKQLAEAMKLSEMAVKFLIIKENLHCVMTTKGVRVLKMSEQELRDKYENFLMELNAVQVLPNN